MLFFAAIGPLPEYFDFFSRSLCSSLPTVSYDQVVQNYIHDYKDWIPFGSGKD